MANETSVVDQDSTRSLAAAGDGDTRVPADEQGISNRPGDEDEDDEFDDDEDGDDEDEEEDEEGEVPS